MEGRETERHNGKAERRRGRDEMTVERVVKLVARWKGGGPETERWGDLYKEY